AAHSEVEGRALAGLGFDPDTAAMVLDDLPAHGKADAGALVFRAVMEPLEDEEDALQVLFLDADAGVAHLEVPLLAFLHGLDMHLDGTIVGPELDRVADQVLEQLQKLHPLAGNRRQLVPRDLRLALGDRGLQVGDGRLDDVIHRDRYDPLAGPSDARIG